METIHYSKLIELYKLALSGELQEQNIKQVMAEAVLEKDKNYVTGSDTSQAITKRFFDAIELLSSNKTIRGLKTFTDVNGINRRNLIRVKNFPECSVLKPEWIYYLCNDYNISASWIITGKGDMLL